MARRLELTVDPKYAGKTVSFFLRREINASAALLSALKRMENGVTVGDVSAKNVHRLEGGERVVVHLPESFEERGGLSNIAPVDLHVKLAFSDEDYALLDKPKAMPVHPSRAHVYDTLANDFVCKFPGIVFRPLSRLDSDTAGLVPIAKNKAAAYLSPREIRKIYYGITASHVPKSRYVVSAPIERAQEYSPRRAVRADGRPATTLIRKVREKNGKTLLRFKLLSGRTHQIRVHCAHMGFPLLGDTLYGGRSLTDDEIKAMGGEGQALVAAYLSFKNPLTGLRAAARSAFLEGLLKVLDLP